MPIRCFVFVVLWVCCMAAQAQEAVVSGHVDLVDPTDKTLLRELSDTAVWLSPIAGSTSGSGIKLPQPLHGPPQLVQKNKSFVPRVLIITAGTAVEFPNHDPFFHNVFSLFEGKRFDLGLYEAGGTRFVHFDRAGISYIFCNIHPEMNAVVIALTTPYYGLTDGAGNIAIRGVPPGRYVIHLWNERAVSGAAETASRELTVAWGGVSFGTIRLPVQGGPLPPHKNKYGRDYDPGTPANPIYQQP
jgi:hypothetical protein